MAESEIARFRERQALEEEAAHQGLSGLAMVGTHAIIAARVQIGATRILQLAKEGRHEEALALLQSPTWGVEEEAVFPQISTESTGSKEQKERMRP